MNMPLLQQAASRISRALRGRRVSAALILGSGWSETARALEARPVLDYDRIPGIGPTGVDGHPGALLLASLATHSVLVFQGRRHRYEGAGWEPVAVPVYAARALGASVMVITNAAGGIRPDLAPGSFMIIDDHINAMGDNPLIGAHDPFWGPRFPDQHALYDPDLRGLLQAAAQNARLRVSRGIYLGVCGPTYETPAEIRAYRSWGADAVGMSTVPEAMLAAACGLRVLGISCITNPAAVAGPAPLAHADVLQTAGRAQRGMTRLLKAFFALLAAPGAGRLAD